MTPADFTRDFNAKCAQIDASLDKLRATQSATLRLELDCLHYLALNAAMEQARTEEFK